MMSALGGGDFELAVRQQPKYACVAIGKGKGIPPQFCPLSVLDHYSQLKAANTVA